MDKKRRLNDLSPKLILQGIILVAVAILIGMALIEIFYSWKSDRWVSHASGVYITLAKDLSEGKFYLPLFGEDGYRGTRYFPLYFSLHALLIKIVEDPIKAGYLLGLIAGVLFLFGVYQFVRKSGGSFLLASAAVAAILACNLTQALITAIRGDILPAALNICGLALFVGTNELTKKKLAAMALLFSLAFAAKVASVCGVTAVWMILLLKRQIKEGMWLALMTFLGFSLVIGISQLFSDGRFIEVVRSCAAAGTSLEGVLKIPTRLRNVIMNLDGATQFLLASGLVSLIVLPKKQRTRISTVYFLLILLVTAIMFSNPGLHVNHFLEPLAASVLLITSLLIIRAERFEMVALSAISSILIIVLGISLTSNNRTAPAKYQKRYALVTEYLKGVKGPILSDNSLIPILMGQNPFMLDAFVFRMLREKKTSASFEKPLFDRIEEKWFEAIVLEKWASSFPGLHFGEGFYESVERNYCLRQETQQWLFYLRCDDRKNVNKHSHLCKVRVRMVNQFTTLSLKLDKSPRAGLQNST
ncbi:hypothetical protein GWO43_20140 [candidate division KSB1 bacterium]|nr:hypothetical protein [candidate division KSB1 bacterium]NIR71674.1 hypothetical protein [candidate division KSB1 bacterium]NIS26386.1 hypothetical protein [candidate division KSB1 bacterium]NIT73145.1 hypothetical protein [candidate division KSB1 bacterium]NIU27072.1 hypothetical protein [candidate division KSB1 bacterium]